MLAVAVLQQLVEAVERCTALRAVGIGWHGLVVRILICAAVLCAPMAEDKISISSHIPEEGEPGKFDRADLEELEELHAVVAEMEGVQDSRSEMVRQGLNCYLGVLQMFAGDGSMEAVPTDMELKHMARQMARTELDRQDELAGRL